MSEFQTEGGQITAPTKPQLFAAVVRKLHARSGNNYNTVGEFFGMSREAVKRIIRNEPGMYHDPSYTPLAGKVISREDGWAIRKNAWRLCGDLYRRYNIVLDFGEYTSIKKQIRSSEAQLIDAARHYPVYSVSLPQHSADPVFVLANLDGLPIAALPYERFARHAQRQSSQPWQGRWRGLTL